jgi:hypothetical protein
MHASFAKRLAAREKFGSKLRRKGAAIQNLCRHGSRFRPMEEDYLERVRKEARLGRHFTPAQFERAARSFREMYQTDPQVVLCSPDVLERFCELYALAGDAHRRELRFEGIRVSAAVMEPGTVAFEGEVDDQRMGDW